MTTHTHSQQQINVKTGSSNNKKPSTSFSDVQIPERNREIDRGVSSRGLNSSLDSLETRTYVPADSASKMNDGCFKSQQVIKVMGKSCLIVGVSRKRASKSGT